ncbi:hypothetical protein E3P99_01631 [Wallemia hederae]|uniref:ABC transporter domain-containing protein n=1 Tax=Wallemia hederae TaxID=1540922 RepID=A0A4T0FP69_9BASI|nr:hypothetical protein E3P99_01631 [Wallemia hederae]
MSALFDARKCLFYALGHTTRTAKPIFRTPLTWTLHEGGQGAEKEAWAVIGPHSMRLVKALFKQSDKPVPATSLTHPLAAQQGVFPWETYSVANFSTRLSSASDGFVDYTARYGSLRGDETLTVSAYLQSRAELGGSRDDKREALVAGVARRLDLERLLDRPLIGLSNGQSRRLKIAHALLQQRSLLVLEEPYTGLDPPSRHRLSDLLHALHDAAAPSVLLLLKPSDELPEYITHVLHIGDDGCISMGPKKTVVEAVEKAQKIADGGSAYTTNAQVGLGETSDRVLVDMRNVTITHRNTPILNNISWKVRVGERWHLQGYNGSGKTTLLSLVTGDHPQSYTKDITLFDSPRNRIATTQLATLIGTASPEITAAFPRSTTLTAFDVVATGFSGVFCYRPTRDAEEVERVHHLLKELTPDVDPKTPYTQLSQSEKNCLLLARALVGKSPLLILDEPFQGMLPADLKRARKYLQTALNSDQAVVFVTHYEKEVPWDIEKGRYIRLKDGRVDFVH